MLRNLHAAADNSAKSVEAQTDWRYWKPEVAAAVAFPELAGAPLQARQVFAGPSKQEASVAGTTSDL